MPKLVPLVVATFAALLASTGTAAAATIPGHYIVVLKPSVSNPSGVGSQLSKQFGGQLGFTYSHAIKGFSVQLSSTAATKLSSAPEVAAVVPDTEVTVAGTPTVAPDPSPQIVVYPLLRIDADKSTTISGDGAGQVNVNVAVLDTGIDLEHHDLNVAGGVNCSNPQSSTSAYDDAMGHGTHVAGLIGAKDNSIGVVGVAPGAPLWAVRVLNDNGAGAVSDLICGVDWVTATHTDANPANDIQVANMSITGKAVAPDDGRCGTTKKQDPLHQAICASVAVGVTYVVAAGNDSSDVAAHLPAAYDEVLTVSAIGDTDGKAGGAGPEAWCLAGQADDAPATFSNFATLASDAAHTVAAPGVCVGSTVGTAKVDNAYGSGSGTSFASPITAGTVADCIYFGSCAGLTPGQIVRKIVADAAAYNNANASYGFTGDPLHSPDPGKYYGYLIRAGQY
jgi:subtilisin family serine protease